MSALVALAALVMTMVVSAAPASAHARLESTSPKDGATVTAMPAEVSLTFNEPIKEGLNQVTVKSGSASVAKGDLEVDGSTVYQPVKSDAKAGKYTVTYKVVSADGHPISGSVSFTYMPPADGEGSGAAPSEGSTSTASPDADSSTSSTSPTSQGTGTQTPDDGASEPDASDESSNTPSQSSDTEPADESRSDGGIPPWVWVAGAAVLALLIGGAALAMRGRRNSEGDEDIDLEEWRE